MPAEKWPDALPGRGNYGEEIKCSVCCSRLHRDYLYVCMYACMYVCTYVRTYVCMYVCNVMLCYVIKCNVMYVYIYGGSESVAHGGKIKQSNEKME